MVKVTNMETKIEWIWNREKMNNRMFVMKEMYEEMEDGEDWKRPPVCY